MAAPHASAVCALVSGGLDSAFLIDRLLARSVRVLPLYVRGGLRWEAAELSWLRRLLRALRTPRLAPLRVLTMPLRSLYGAHWSLTGQGVPGAASADAAVYLPGRNVLLLTAAAIACHRTKIGALALGTLAGNPFSDATPRFFRRMAGCLSQALDLRLRILAPLRRMTKSQLVRQAGRLPLQLTFSCLQPRGLAHCGRCNKCAERRRAFRRAGVEDPTRYG